MTFRNSPTCDFSAAADCDHHIVADAREMRMSLKRPAEANLVYRPKDWTRIKKDTNCYTYALDIPAHGWGQPGQLRIHPADRTESYSFTQDTLPSLLESDGLIKVDISDLPACSEMLIAAIVYGSEDFHFYRRDQNGFWSHKWGNGRVKRLDSSGHLIRSPEKCVERGVNSFVGYFVVPRQGIQYSLDAPTMKKISVPAYTEEALRNEISELSVN
ncbi:MAG: hypothetical protein GC137_09410 [Alphaproteobacteria bacterium]|nr:hypothetical protein [Alphaproteobacteria bacterium]